jgi:hypothetical protein
LGCPTYLKIADGAVEAVDRVDEAEVFQVAFVRGIVGVLAFERECGTVERARPVNADVHARVLFDGEHEVAIVRPGAGLDDDAIAHENFGGLQVVLDAKGKGFWIRTV